MQHKIFPALLAASIVALTAAPATALEHGEPATDSQEAHTVAQLRLPSSSGHPICADLVSVGEDVHCESTAQEIHAGVPA